MSGWPGPNDETIAERAKALARADHLGAVVVPETREVRRRAELRNQAERPPSHKRAELADCRIWEQCLDLLARCHIVFVSADDDFRGHREPDSLHPALRAEADEVAEDRSLTFHRTMESLLSELRSEIQPIPNDVVFTFVYESIASVLEELESNSGCQPKEVGEVKQTLLTTDQAEVIEVRLGITDIWESADKAKTMDFRLSGSCHYRLAEEKLCDLTPSSVRLLTQRPDGSVRAVEGSYISVSAHRHGGAPPYSPGARRVRGVEVPAPRAGVPGRAPAALGAATGRPGSAELGDGAASSELVARVVRWHAGRLPIARFLELHQAKRRLLRATARSRPGASVPTRARPRPRPPRRAWR